MNAKLFSILFGMSTIVAALPASAATGPMDSQYGTWTGSGTQYDALGNATGGFTDTVTTSPEAGGAVRVEGTVTLASGKQIQFWQDQTPYSANSSSFSVDSNDGSGSGQCFDNKMCQVYITGSDGNASSTTISWDSDSQMRMLTTELQNGKATGFTEETLKKAQ